MSNRDIIPLRDEWTGKFGFILSLTGAAVGLGNIWRFPYLLNQGGGIFVILYGLCMLLLVLPIMFFEIRMGQIMRLNPIDAFQKTCSKYKAPKLFVLNAYLGLLIVFCVLTFYTIVSGWVIYYLFNSLFTMPATTFEESQAQWNTLLSTQYAMVFFNLLFLLLNFVILTRGVKKGLEMLNRLMLPSLIIILLFMLIFAIFSEDMSVGRSTKLLFSFDFSNFETKILISALGQALFTLAVGACAILTYGAYLPKAESRILMSSNIIIITQLVISIALGIVIYSLLLEGDSVVFEDVSGPQLIFVVLPVFFSKTALPKILTSMFFVITFFAAITSSVNIAEPMIYTLTDKYKLTRLKACALVIFCIAFSSTLLTLSFGMEYDFFGNLVNIITEFAMPIAAFIFSVLAGWFVDKTLLKTMISNQMFYIFAKYSMRFLFPIALILIVLF